MHDSLMLEAFEIPALLDGTAMLPVTDMLGALAYVVATVASESRR
ncbi:MAG: hypothetical protein ACHP9W_06935 [Steroidobacterales bacterium]